jgi:ABC-type transporter Mla subunit MlaD
MTRPGRTERRAIAALIAALVGAIVLNVATRGAGTYTLRAVFDNVNGLVASGNVEVAGFKVGTITGLSVRVGGYPEVTMRISDAYRVRRGAHAVIELGSLAGQLNRYVALTGGTGPPLPDGATIPRRDTSTPVEIDQFLSALTPRVRTDMRRLLHEAVYTLRGHGDDIERTLQQSAAGLRQIAAALGDLTADGPALRTLIGRAADGAQQVAAEPADVRTVIDRLGRLLAVAARRQADLGAALRRMPATMEAVRAAMRRIGSSLPVFSRLLSAAGPALGALRPFAIALRVAAPDSLPTLRDGVHLLDVLRNASPALARLFGPPRPSTLRSLGATLTELNPPLDFLRATAPDALEWLPLDGEETANYSVNGHGGLVLVYPRAAPRRPVASPSCRAGWLLRPFFRIPGQAACDPWTSYASTFVGGGRSEASYLTPALTSAWPGEFGGTP